MGFFQNLVLLVCLLFTFLAKAQVDSSKSDISFDFGLTRNKNLNLWPLLKKTKSDDLFELKICFSTFKYSNDFQNNQKHSHLFPLFIKDKSDSVSDLKLLTTYYPSVYRYSQNHQDSSTSLKLFELAPEINFLEISRSKDGMNVQNNLFFFLWYKNNQRLKISHLIGFPLYWNFTSPEKTTSTLFPLYSKGSNSYLERKYLAITPLFWQFKTVTETKTRLLPICYSSKEITYADTIKRNTLFPIYWSYKDSEKNNKIVFPIAWSLNNKYYSSFTLLPLVSVGHSKNKQKSHLGITPFIWYSKDSLSNKFTAFPIWYKRTKIHNQDTIKSNVIFPIYWSNQNTFDTSKVLFPLIFNFKNKYYSSSTFFPLYSTGESKFGSRSHRVVTPFYWSFKDYNYTKKAFLPIWFSSLKVEGIDSVKSTVLFPIYWSHKEETSSNQIIFPVYWKYHSIYYDSKTVFPFYSYGQTNDSKIKHIAVTPLIWYLKDSISSKIKVYPFFFHTRKIDLGDTIRSNVFFPIYWSKKAKYETKTVLFPVIWKFENWYSKSLTVFPFYSRGINTSDIHKKYYAITPLFWHFEDSLSKKNNLLPLFYSSSKIDDWKDTINKTVLFPLYWSYGDKYKTNRVIFPIVWSFKKPTSKSFTVFPLFSKGSNFKYNSKYYAVTPFIWHLKDSLVTKTTIFPLLFQKEEITKKDTIHSLVSFPLYWHYKNKTRSHSVLFPIVWKYDSKYYSSFTLFPLYSRGAPKNEFALKTYSHKVITPFYWSIKDTNSFRKVIFPIWFNYEKTDGKDTIQSKVVFPFYWSLHKEGRHQKVIFPIVWKMKNDYYNSFKVLPFYSKVKYNHFPFEQLMVTPLYWHTHNKSKVSTTLIPLFQYSKDTLNQSTKFSILYALYRYKNINNLRTSSVLWPIIEHTKGEGYKAFRISPIIWYKKSVEDSYFSIQPFYFQRKTPTETTYRLLFELYKYKRSNEIKNYHAILWKLITYKKYYNKNYDFRILQELFVFSKQNGTIERSIFPLFNLVRKENGNKSTSLFFNFYHSFKQKVPNSSEYYQEIKLFWFLRIASNYNYLKSKGLVIDKKSRVQKD